MKLKWVITSENVQVMADLKAVDDAGQACHDVNKVI